MRQAVRAMSSFQSVPPVLSRAHVRYNALTRYSGTLGNVKRLSVRTTPVGRAAESVPGISARWKKPTVLVNSWPAISSLCRTRRNVRAGAARRELARQADPRLSLVQSPVVIKESSPFRVHARFVHPSFEVRSTFVQAWLAICLKFFGNSDPVRLPRRTTTYSRQCISTPRLITRHGLRLAGRLPM